MNIHKYFRLYLTLPFLFLLAACSFNLSPQSDFFDEEIMESFEKVLELITENDVSGLKDISLPELANIENFDEDFGKILSYAGEASNAEIIIVENRISDNSDAAEKIFYAAYEYKNGNKYDIIEIALQKFEDECCFLRHMNFSKNDVRNSTYHNFKSQNFTFKRILFITLMTGTLFFILFTLVVVVRDKNLNRKWLWVIFVLFGTYGLTLNWTTGQLGPNFIKFHENGGVNFSIIKFNLFGGGFERAGLLRPWIFEWGFPLGATLYYIKRRKNKKNRIS